jgi:membrane dipeptidase
MGRNKKWDGYRSWSYLEPRVDYMPYELQKELDRFPEYDFGLTKTQEERVEELVEKNIVISLHEHLRVMWEHDILSNKRRIFKGFEALSRSCLDGVFEAVGHSTGPSSDDIINDIGMSQCDYAHQDMVIPALKVDDLTRAHKEGKIAVMQSHERLEIGTEIDMIDLYFGLGLRMAGLVAYWSNTIGTDLDAHADGGLTEFGYDVVKRMNKTGMIIDISHCSELTVMEAVEASDKPIVASHRGSKTLTYLTRMLSDEATKAMAEKGGLIAVESAGFGLRTKEHPAASIEGTLDHIKHIIDVIGADHAGVGLDSHWGDHVRQYKEGGERRKAQPKPSYSRPRPADLPPRFDTYKLRADTPPEHPHIQGAENPADIINVAKGLVRDGYSDSEIAKVMGQNALRVIKANWPK